MDLDLEKNKERDNRERQERRRNRNKNKNTATHWLFWSATVSGKMTHLLTWWMLGVRLSMSELVLSSLPQVVQVVTGNAVHQLCHAVAYAVSSQPTVQKTEIQCKQVCQHTVWVYLRKSHMQAIKTKLNYTETINYMQKNCCYALCHHLVHLGRIKANIIFIL